MEKLENLLKELGLNEYEAKTYIALITHGICNADEISNLACIPLPRVYDTVNHLEKKGFVLITKTRPQQYMPIKSDEALRNFISWREKEYQNQMESLRKLSTDTLEYLKSVETKEKPPGEKWRIWTTEGRKGISSAKNNFIKSAKREVLLMAGDASFMTEESAVFRKLLGKGVKIKLLVRGTESRETMRHLKKLVELGAELRTGYDGSMRGNVIDDSAALIYLKSSEKLPDIPDDTNKYEMIAINNPNFIKIVKEHFDLHWNRVKS
jgi:sugar-specific transcriptional regulator TrmB